MTHEPWTHQGLAVEYYFDPQTEKQILDFRNSIYQQGVRPVLGAMNDRPHISLAVFGRVDPQPLVNLSREFSRQLTPFEIQLSAIGVFPTEDNVLFLIPAANSRLLQVHAEFHELVKQERIVCSPLYLPGNWVPHCTLEFDLSKAQLKKALQLSQAAFTPLKGTLVELGVVAFRPITYLADFKLGVE